MISKFQTQIFLLRLIDILLSLVLIFFLLPVYFLIALFILFDGLPILYLSKRVGKNGIIFVMFKFRSMDNIKDNKISDTKRLNKLGIFLRRTSLDEIPQLFNIFLGEMSLVGPRALPLSIEKKIPKKSRIIRRKVAPGVTGLSQINYTGKKRTLSQKIKFDIEYVKNLSIFNYFKILFMTFFVLIRRYKYNKKGYSL